MVTPAAFSNSLTSARGVMNLVIDGIIIFGTYLSSHI